MPLYEYRCNSCQSKFEKFLPLERYKEPQLCTCGAVGEKLISAVRVINDYPGYNCPITNDWIEGRKAHEENLKKHGCRVYEGGEKEDMLSRKAREEQELENALTDTAMAKVAALPAKDVEALGNFLESHEVNTTRQSV